MTLTQMRQGVLSRHAVVVAVLALTTVVVFLQPAIRQPLDYHVMADQRPCVGVANCLNVLSNVPFAIVGIAGLAMTFVRRGRFSDSWECWPYAALFGGVTVTAFGSSYYHLAPDNARLVWDRLPMTVGFIGLLTALVAERVGVAIARRFLLPGLAFGVFSVLYWHLTERQGHGDLRPYVLVQFGSLLLVAVLLALYRSRYNGTTYIVSGLVLYAVAKVLESADAAIYSAVGIVSGHTLKHLVAALAAASLVWMLHVRGHGVTDGVGRSHRHAFSPIAPTNVSSSRTDQRQTQSHGPA